MRELVVMFNEENSDATNYKQIQQVISTEKHILEVGEKNEDDCRCKKCENTELLLAVIKQYTKLDISVDPHEFISKIVCSMKSYECLNEECEKCEKSEIMNNVMEALERVEEITYARWIHLDGKYEKREFITSGLEINELLLNTISKNFKILCTISTVNVPSLTVSSRSPSKSVLKFRSVICI